MAPNIDMSVDFCGIELPNPTVLASGILGVTAKTMQSLVAKGCGAVTLKSISHEARPGFANPTMIANEHYFMNAVGLSGVGVDQAGGVVRDLKQHNTVVIASIFSDSAERTAEVGAKFEAYGADMLEINASCPNLKAGEKIGMTVGVNPSMVEHVVAEVKKHTRIPVILKLTPNVTDIVEIAKAAVAGGADALCAVNTFGPGLKIDIETAQPVLHNKFGGLSGPGIFPLALAIIYKLYQAVNVPLLAMGGIMTYQDALEMAMAGATAIGVGTAVYYQGEGAFAAIADGMSSWLGDHGHTGYREIVGLSHRV